jgi:transcriptional regulator with XRE-family HTH domain
MAERGAEAIEDGPPPAALVKLRQLLGLSQFAIASKLGLKEALIRRLETGNTPVSMPAASAYRQLARECGYDLDQLAA